MFFTNCRKEKIITDGSAKAEFSVDTLLFDTVFTTIGSTYKRFTVHNPHNNTLILSNVRLVGGTSSSFRMNVDGVSGVSINDIEILPKDSIYVFVEVTIDPNRANNPFVVEDEIKFIVNGNLQSVQLAAWGQNAYFHRNELVCGETWSNDKPHVIYGIAAVGFPGVDSNCTLTINAGTKIYGHSGATLYIYKSRLIINGTQANKVVFQGDRLESSFQNEPGQWFGVRFAIAQNSEIKHTVIKNAVAGLYVDTAFGIDSLLLNNVESYNHTFSSLFAQGANINARNCLFGNSGESSVALRLGGTYYLNHCTIGNYWSKSTRTKPAFILNNYYQSGITVYVRPFNRASINNSIIYGNNDNEIVLDTINAIEATYTFNHCLIKTDQTLTSKFISTKNNLDPRFVSTEDFHILSSSPSRDIADPFHYEPKDLEENSRSNPADIGCFEYVP